MIRATGEIRPVAGSTLAAPAPIPGDRRRNKSEGSCVHYANQKNSLEVRDGGWCE